MTDAMWQHDVKGCMKAFRDKLGLEPSAWRCPCGRCKTAVLYAVGPVPANAPGLFRTRAETTTPPARVLWVMPTISQKLQGEDGLLLMGLENMTEVDRFIERVAGYVKLRNVSGAHFEALTDALYAAAKEIVS